DVDRSCTDVRVPIDINVRILELDGDEEHAHTSPSMLRVGRCTCCQPHPQRSHMALCRLVGVTVAYGCHAHETHQAPCDRPPHDVVPERSRIIDGAVLHVLCHRVPAAQCCHSRGAGCSR